MDELNEENLTYKTYKTIDEQIRYLKENKRIIVLENQKYILENRNYISIINPYKEFFATGHIIIEKNGVKAKLHQYGHDTTIGSIEELAKLDDSMSTIFFEFIGNFERKFKNLLVGRICSLYNENCLAGLSKDIYCIKYLKEINTFLNNQTRENLPRFCANFYNIIQKNRYSYSEYPIESRTSFLEKIYNIGLGTSEESRNTLILHYIRLQHKAPFWVIANALTLGELHMLYMMLDSGSQKWILSKMKNIEVNKIRIKDIFDFSGQLELLRRIRNITNHYEPIIPFFINTIKEKRIENSKMIEAIRMLKFVSDKISFCDNNLNFPSIKENDYNIKKIRIIKLIISILSNE